METDYESLQTEFHTGDDQESYVRIRRCDHDFPDKADADGRRNCRNECGAVLRGRNADG